MKKISESIPEFLDKTASLKTLIQRLLEIEAKYSPTHSNIRYSLTEDSNSGEAYVAFYGDRDETEWEKEILERFDKIYKENE